MKLDLFWVDAFSPSVFGGNPAAVILLDAWLPAELMQSIGTENGLPMTAFSVRSGEGRWHIRWFSPSTEVTLCGHATLATAFVLLDVLGRGADRVEFESRGGPIAVARSGNLLELDFPSNAPEPLDRPTSESLEAFRVDSNEWHCWQNYFLAILRTEHEVRATQPDFSRWSALGDVRLIVSAPGRDCDFASRFFAPGIGIPEDSVTGSAHCVLVPYWARRLERRRLTARQLSARGGELSCEWTGDRVKLGGECALYLRGSIEF